MGIAQQARALELEMGIGATEFPLYPHATHPNQYDRRTIGKIALSHTFEMNDWSGIRLWADHYSLLSRPEPSSTPYGRNMAGASVVFKLY